MRQLCFASSSSQSTVCAACCHTNTTACPYQSWLTAVPLRSPLASVCDFVISAGSSSSSTRRSSILPFCALARIYFAGSSSTRYIPCAHNRTNACTSFLYMRRSTHILQYYTRTQRSATTHPPVYSMFVHADRLIYSRQSPPSFCSLERKSN